MLLMRPGESTETKVAVWVNAVELGAASFESGLLIRYHHWELGSNRAEWPRTGY